MAKALDVVGDRWTLLIVRELLVQGPCRYTDLRNGLPGIATNLLAERLRELESAGLLRREVAPPPVATTLFHLTAAGAELEPVLDALGRWGTRYMSKAGDRDVFRSHWFAYPVSLFLHDSNPDGPPTSIELRTTDRPVVIEVANGSVRTRVGSTAEPDLVLNGSPDVIMGVLSGQLTLSEGREQGLQVVGDSMVLKRIQPDATPSPSS